MEKYSIAVIGGWESIMGFKALGLDTYPAANAEEAKKILNDLAQTDCAVIYLTENLAQEIPKEIARYNDRPKPAVIMIPGRDGSLGLGLSALNEAVERAVGTNILEN